MPAGNYGTQQILVTIPIAAIVAVAAAVAVTAIVAIPVMVAMVPKTVARMGTIPAATTGVMPMHPAAMVTIAGHPNPLVSIVPVVWTEIKSLVAKTD